MIKVYIHEQLGNQLFQYAAARALSQQRGNDAIFLDISEYGRARKTYRLDRFPLKAHEISPLPHLFLKKIGLRKQRAVMYDKLPRIGGGHLYEPLFFKEKRNCFLYGMFQSYHFVEPVKEALSNEFRPSNITSPQLERWESELRSCESVALHVRRGDYVNNRSLDICTPAYYQRAIASVRASIPEARIYVFSNDHSYCRAELGLTDVKYVHVENAMDHALADFYLMRACRHFIIANSTFSWWPAYLAGADSMVCCPYIWSSDGTMPIDEKAPPHWQQIRF